MKTLAALAAVLLLAACGSETPGEPRDPGARSSDAVRPTEVPAATGPVTTRFPITVLDDGDGAELCLGGVADSYPPQCGGPELVGWDWQGHEGDFEEAAGVRWGEFVVTGTFDGTALTPTDVIAAAEFEEDPPQSEPSFSTPCPEPAGGWAPVDAAKAGYDDMNHAFARASRLDDYVTAFIDTSRDDRTPEEMDQDAAAGDKDISLWIVNVQVTGDAAAAEAEIREVWGGPLCVVSGGDHTDAELRAIQEVLYDVPGFASSSGGPNTVDIYVTYDDGSLQAWVDQEYGTDVVRIFSALVPIED